MSYEVEVGGVPGQPGSRWHTTYENACAEPSLLLNCECATAARSMYLYNKSFKICKLL